MSERKKYLRIFNLWKNFNMDSNSKKQHWEKIYREKDAAREASWYQDIPKTSIDLGNVHTHIALFG
ncbi:TPA: hypothetical protein DEW47_03050 [Patescibacteria group bacterium]|nr:hypothetical protein [Patescibacteria group bacterium]